MRRLTGWLTLALALCAAPVWAQNPNVLTPSPQTAGSVSSGSCTSNTNCAVWDITQVKSVTLQVNGTFSGTLTFEGTSDGTNWFSVSMAKLSAGTSSTTTTTTGQFSLVNSGLTGIRARMTSYASGTASVWAVLGNAGSIPLPGQSGGNLTAGYWITVADASLPNAQVLGALSSGLVFNTTTTGVPSVVVCATTGTVLVGGAPPSCTDTPTVTSLSASTSVIAPLFRATGATRVTLSTDGKALITNNAATSGFTLGNNTSQELHVYQLDGTSYANIYGRNITAETSRYIQWSNRTNLLSPADGQMRMANAAETQTMLFVVGSGTPEGVVTATVGSVYFRTNGGAGTSFYVKESGSGNTGWVGK